MNSTSQPGTHPDAESLTAFAEQVLPAAERDEILVHMSSCSRCREVVFLAQQAMEDAEPAPVAVAVEAPFKSRSSWLNWRWAWIPAAACAFLIGIAVMHHYRGVATETQTAVNVAPKEALPTPASPKTAAQSPPTRNAPARTKTANSSDMMAEREAAPANSRRDEADRLEAQKLEEKKPVDHKDVTLAAAPPAPAFAVSGGSMHSMMEARAKTSAIGGPSAANQLQQQSLANQQNSLQPPQNAGLDAANKPKQDSPQAQSETVTVQAQAVVPTVPAAAPVSEQLNSDLSADQKEVASPALLGGTRKKANVALPSGLGALSVAKIVGRTIALDTKGALFLSEDDGENWKPVRTQWTGRAVLVRGLANAADKGNALEGAVLKISPTAKFELVTDDLQTWLSPDGNVWTLQPMPGK